MGFVVDKEAQRQVSSEYSAFPCQFSVRHMLHTHLPSRAGAIGELVADVTSRTPPHEKQETKNVLTGLTIVFLGLEIEITAGWLRGTTLSTKVHTNFAGKRRWRGQYSSLEDSGHAASFCYHEDVGGVGV
jgi:hypothetical protein